MLIDFGIDIDSFLNNYFSKNIYLKRKAISSEIMSLKDIDKILYCVEPKIPHIKLHNGDQFIDEEDYIESYQEIGIAKRRIIRPKFYEHLLKGATVILNRVEGRSELLKKICFEISNFVTQQTLANGYLSFGIKPSFGNHWDVHDVFAVQLIGRKHWKVYRPTFELPIYSQTSKDFKSNCPEEPVLDTLLEAGDILYIPRGWWHNATAIGEETFHVAVGVHTPYVMDYVTWVCSTYLRNHLECRKSITFKEESYSLVLEATDIIKETILNRTYFEEFQKEIIKSERINSPFDIGAHLKKNIFHFNDNTLISLNTGYTKALDNSNKIFVNGVEISNVLEGYEKSIISILSQQGITGIQTIADTLNIPLESAISKIQNLRAKDIVQISA